MIKMINCVRLQRLEEELENLETRILKSKVISRMDLQELEGLSNMIQLLRMEMAELIKK